MDINMETLSNILEQAIGKKVRYRREGTNVYTNDILGSYKVDTHSKSIVITLRNNKVTTNYVKNISYSQQEERIDICIYGNKTNRFNISVSADILKGILQ